MGLKHKELDDVSVRYDAATQVVTLTRGERSLDIMLFDEGRIRQLWAAAAQIYAQNTRQKKAKQK